MKKLFIITLLSLIAAGSFACRFTIREIGYTRLNIETYLIRLDADTTKYSKLTDDFRNLAYAYSINSNINYQITHTTGKEPEIRCTNSSGDVIMRKEAVTLSGIHKYFKALLFSPLQQTMYRQIGNVFAYVIVIGNNNKKVNGIVDDALVQFKKIAPNLDKKVDEQIMKIVLSKERIGEEEVVLRSMGIDTKSGNPAVVVIYGRGRLTDIPLTGDRITTHNLLNQLVTLGTDCECGIDLSPLLQRAIPFSWNEQMGQDVTDMLDIDVENPMTLTEMGRILSKEPLETGKSDFSFVPQTIDLDKELAKGRAHQNEEVIADSGDSKVLTTTMVVLGLFILLILLGGGFLFFGKKGKLKV